MRGWYNKPQRWAFYQTLFAKPWRCAAESWLSVRNTRQFCGIFSDLEANNLAWLHEIALIKFDKLYHNKKIRCIFAYNIDGAYTAYRKCLAMESIFIQYSTQFMRFRTKKVTVSWLALGLYSCLWSIAKPTLYATKNL